MSTSGLKGYINGGTYTASRVTHDAYPSGLGVDFYKDCRNKIIDLIEYNNISFIRNSLFCEWAYFYDIDNNIFEIWKGFQTKPDPTNPFGQELNLGYYPCKRIFKGNINNINENLFTNENVLSLLVQIQRDEKINDIIDKNLF